MAHTRIAALAIAVVILGLLAGCDSGETSTVPRHLKGTWTPEGSEAPRPQIEFDAADPFYEFVVRRGTETVDGRFGTSSTRDGGDVHLHLSAEEPFVVPGAEELGSAQAHVFGLSFDGDDTMALQTLTGEARSIRLVRVK